jgi:hypothetical protein
MVSVDTLSRDTIPLNGGKKTINESKNQLCMLDKLLRGVDNKMLLYK